MVGKSSIGGEGARGASGSDNPTNTKPLGGLNSNEGNHCLICWELCDVEETALTKMYSHFNNQVEQIIKTLVKLLLNGDNETAAFWTVRLIEDNSNRQFCKCCFKTAYKLYSLHQQFELLQQEMDVLVNGVKGNIWLSDDYLRMGVEKRKEECMKTKFRLAVCKLPTSTANTKKNIEQTPTKVCANEISSCNGKISSDRCGIVSTEIVASSAKAAVNVKPMENIREIEIHSLNNSSAPNGLGQLATEALKQLSQSIGKYIPPALLVKGNTKSSSVVQIPFGRNELQNPNASENSNANVNVHICTPEISETQQSSLSIQRSSVGHLSLNSNSSSAPPVTPVVSTSSASLLSDSEVLGTTENAFPTRRSGRSKSNGIASVDKPAIIQKRIMPSRTEWKNRRDLRLLKQENIEQSSSRSNKTIKTVPTASAERERRVTNKLKQLPDVPSSVKLKNEWEEEFGYDEDSDISSLFEDCSTTAPPVHNSRDHLKLTGVDCENEVGTASVDPDGFPQIYVFNSAAEFGPLKGEKRKSFESRFGHLNVVNVVTQPLSKRQRKVYSTDSYY